MGGFELITALRRDRLRVWAIIFLAAVGVLTVWIEVGSGPEICGFQFPNDGNCWPHDRQRTGWIATAAICIGVAAYGVVSVRCESRLARMLGWTVALGIIAACVASALLALK